MVIVINASGLRSIPLISTQYLLVLLAWVHGKSEAVSSVTHPQLGFVCVWNSIASTIAVN